MAAAYGGHQNDRSGRSRRQRLRDVRVSRPGYVAERGADCFLRRLGRRIPGRGCHLQRWRHGPGTEYGRDHLVFRRNRRDLRAWQFAVRRVRRSANLALRPLAYRFYPSQQAGLEQEVTYVCDLVCRPEDEAHIRALLLQAIAQTPLTLTALKSEDIEGTGRMKVLSQIRGLGRQDQALEQLVVRLSLEGGVSSISWSVTAQVLE